MDKEFLQRIKQKLQIGNTRSIHLNAYPGRLLLRLDAFELNILRKGLPEEFIHLLFNQTSFSLKFIINPDDLPIPNKKHNDKENIVDEKKRKVGIISKRLTSMLYENEDNFLEHGIKTFGFGFPMLVYRTKSDSSKIIYAPIIIWKLDISRNLNEWSITRNDDFGISMNEVMLNYLEQDIGTTGLSRISEGHLEDNVIDTEEMQFICDILLSEIGQSIHKLNILDTLLPLDSKANLNDKFQTYGNPYIAYSGVFGLFRNQKEAVIKDIKELISNADKYQFDNYISEKYQTTTFSAIETDPVQSKVLTDIGNNNKLIIHGPPGTGKSQSLSAIITNALANDVKCLVVCEKKTALEVIRKNLELKGLGELCGLVEDVHRDRKSIINSVRERTANSNNWDYKILEDIIKDTKVKIDNINNGHKYYGKIILNNYNWTTLVGKFINLRKKTNKTEKLFDDLKDLDFNFISDDINLIYNRNKNSITDIFGFYNDVKESINDFRMISDKFIVSGQQIELSMKLKSYLSKTNDLLILFLENISSALDDYKEQLLKHFDNFKSDSLTIVNEIINIYEINYSKFGKHFYDGNIFSKSYVKFLSFFSHSYKQMLADKEKMYDLFLKLKKYSVLKYFKQQFDESKHPEDILNQTKCFKNNLENWYLNVHDVVKISVNNLSLNDYNKNFGYSTDNIKKMLESYDILIKNIKEKSIINVNINENAMTVLDIRDSLTKLKNAINFPLSKISEFSDYHSYRYYYLNTDIKTQKITDSLIKNDSQNWLIDFDAWFIFNLLINYDSKITLRNDTQIKTLNDNFKIISQYQVRNILDYWRFKQHESSQKFQSSFGYNKNALYNLAKNKRFQKQNSLRKIINSDFELFTDYFPILLLNPTVCSSLFKMQEGLFDLVIFDEASQLRIEDVYAAKLRGKNRIVAGDENQMPPSNYFIASFSQIDNRFDEYYDDEESEIKGMSSSIADSESLLEYAKRKGFKETYLEIHYRSRHPDLIDFSNAAFYGSRLKPMPPYKDYSAIIYYPVNGIYDQESGVNIDEAEYVIKIIDKEVQLNDGFKIPSIGIATLNITQRNQILDRINERCNIDNEFANKIYKLKELKGEELFVKNLENIQGDERDIIIISTTFGLRADGSFIQNYGPLNQEKGFRLLNVIVTRAKYRIYVCTSIPDKYISEYSNLLAAGSNKGRAIFYSYIAYAKAVSDGDLKKKFTILNLLKDKSENKYIHPDDAFTESVFEQEVLDLLSENFNPNRLRIQYQLGGFRIDIVVLSKDLTKPIIAIECDGTHYHSSPEAYAWDMFRQKFLEDYGIKFIRIWSTNWFYNSQKELKKLLDFINSVDTN